MKTSSRIGVLAMGAALALAAAAGAATPDSITMTVTNDATVAWQWGTQYLVSATSAGNGSVGGNTNDWIDAGGAATLTATADPHYHFVSWSGVPPAVTSSNPATFAVDQAYIGITAQFAPDRHTVTVITPYGTASPGTTNVEYGTSLTQSVAPAAVTNAPGTRVILKGVNVQGNDYTTP